MFNPKTYLMTSLVQSLDCPEALCVSTTKRESLNSRIRFQPHMWVQLVTVLKQRPVVSQSVCVEKRVMWEKTFKQWKGERMADSLGNCCSYQPPNHMGGATSAAGETYLHLPVHSLQNSEKLVHFITQISTYSPPLPPPHSSLTAMLSTYKQNYSGDSLVRTTSQSTRGKTWFLPTSKLQLLFFLKQEEPKGRIKIRNWYGEYLKTV